MIRDNIRLLLVGLVLSVVFPLRADEVRVYESPLTIPTYRIGPPEQMPSWGRGDVYPYTMYEKLTDDRYDRTYRALWVENDYVKALVLPEIGGRLHGAMDKTNGYQFLYNQVVIKPGLVGMAGAWISGGVEWNFPHGHRPSGFRDTDWRLQENPDGSKTAWSGEIDRVYGMRWSVGTTVYPGRSYVETKVRLYNSTPYAHSFQYWATSAVRATYEYQAVIPTEIVTGHSKRQFNRWPVDNGVDQTYWKNLPAATSFFAWDCDADYFGGYSPEEKAGIVIYGDHNIIRGKKLWTWGMAPSGRIWENILTDGDLPYFEPQAGAYSDNQPDYHWIMPGETKVFSHFWFPVRNIGVYDYANLEGALNIELEGGKAKIGWSPTGVNKNARVVLTSGGQTVFEKVVETNPASPFLAEAKAPAGADLYSLAMTVLSADGDTLLHFRHPKPANPPFPEPLRREPQPDQVKTVDELFIYGDRVEMFRSPERALDYYQEALKRDPGDIRCNAAMGAYLVKTGQYEKAREYLEKALQRDEFFAKAIYYLGLTDLWLKDGQSAEKHLNHASYDLAYYGAANFELAQLAASQGRWEHALSYIDRSLQGNGDNAQAHAVRALVLNRLGLPEQALAAAREIQRLDPLDLLSLSERAVALDKLGRAGEAAAVRDTLLMVTRGDSDNHLELAIRYARCGLFQDAVEALKAAGREGWTDQASISPLVYYYQAYYCHLLGRKQEADRLRALGNQAHPKYCFPSRLEDIQVLSWAVETNPQDARALYYLGTVLYSKSRKDEAVSCWQKSVALEPGNAVAQRNLGYSLWEDKKDSTGAIAAYQAAIKADPDAAKAIMELDVIYKATGMGNQERLAFLDSRIEQVSTMDALLTRLISLYVQMGRYDDALKWLERHHFHSWEGRYGIHQYWVESHISKGDQAFEKGDYQEALRHYELSLTYPLNLEVAAQPRAITARNHCKIASTLEKLGRTAEARKMYELVLEDRIRPDNAYIYFRGKALEALGRPQEAREVYQSMLDDLDQRMRPAENDDNESALFFDPERNPRAIQLYKRYLALEGLGRKAEAETERGKALALDPIVALRAFSAPRAGW